MIIPSVHSLYCTSGLTLYYKLYLLELTFTLKPTKPIKPRIKYIWHTVWPPYIYVKKCEIFCNEQCNTFYGAFWLLYSVHLYYTRWTTLIFPLKILWILASYRKIVRIEVEKEKKRPYFGKLGFDQELHFQGHLRVRAFL